MFRCGDFRARSSAFHFNFYLTNKEFIQVSQVEAISAPVLALPNRTKVSVAPQATSIPWTIWFVATGICCAFIGGTWDISWHMSIGRETFWTPAHLLIQTEAVLVGIAVLYTILTTTFGAPSATRDASVE